MAVTFGTLKSTVERYVIDLPAAVTTEVPNLVNKAIKDLQDRHNFKVMEAETSQMQTTNGSHTLASVPAAFKEYRGHPYLVDNTGDTSDLLLAANREAVLDAYSLSDTSDVGEPKVLLDAEPTDEAGARSWEVYPFPDGNSDWANGEYRVVVPYWKYLADLTADANSNWFTTHARWYITFQAVSDAFFLDWDEERGAVYQQKADLQFNKVLLADKLFRISGVRTLVPQKGARGPKLRA